MGYGLLKLIHVGTVGMTLGLFVLRGIWMIGRSPRLEARWTRVVPHANDTLLLLAAVGMLFVGGLNPLIHPWLLAKFSGLLAYIGLGSLALRRGKTYRQRILFFFMALAMFGYIAAVALTKQCVPGLV